MIFPTELQEQVLIALSSQRDPIKTKDLALRMNLPPRQVGATIKSLCDRGCVSRVGIKDWADSGPYAYQMNHQGLEYLLECPPRETAIDRTWLYKLHLRLQHDHGLQMASGSRFDYPEGMDDECITLCDALNCIPGIKTFESCCGHGERPFSVWMTAASIPALYPLTRSIDPRYSGPTFHADQTSVQRWTLEVTDTDLQDMPITFLLHSDDQGPHDLHRLTQNADTIALNIHDTLKLMAEAPPSPR